MTDEKVLKVSDLPEQEQKELIAEALSAGVRGVNLSNYKVETLKAKIAEKKAETGGDEQASAKDEQANGGETKTDETKTETLKAAKGKNQKTGKIPGEKIVKKEVKKGVNGICHICGSRVKDGICSGCGFTRK